jgi:uncharacterized protein involved in response to NO
MAKGFRPFFLLAALHAALFMPAWLLVLRGTLRPASYLGGTYWHAHEMLFGFTAAVVAGFLLTAVGNWTSRETVTGAPLALLALLWLAGRAAILLSDRLPRPMPALVDLAFLPALAVACARPIFQTDNRRNFPFVVLLGGLALANLGMHGGALGFAPLWIRRGAWLAVHLVTVMILVMSARIVPMFTRNATGVQSITNAPTLDRVSVGGMVTVTALDALVAAVTGLTVFLRMIPWGTRYTLKQPLLWILHAGHAFVGLGLVLRGLALYSPTLGPSAALHALTAGAIGSLTLGMMARVSLGHTGRMLAVKPVITLAFALVVLAAIVRVVGPLLGARGWLHAMLGSGALFSLAFLLYAVVYTPILLAPRVDGKPG